LGKLGTLNILSIKGRKEGFLLFDRGIWVGYNINLNLKSACLPAGREG